jgi:hypothetical protein
MTKFIKNIFLVTILFNLSSCSMAGWIGYYEMKDPAKYSRPMDFNIPNSADINNNDFGISLPKGCSGFSTLGILTPFTPPFPIPNFRNISFFDNSCNSFTVNADIPGAEIYLKANNHIYEKISLYKRGNKTKYTFPIKAKNIDSGSIIIKKNSQTIEVPFEYKYFKFWH